MDGSGNEGWMVGAAISKHGENDNDYHLIRKVPSYKDLLIEKTPRYQSWAKPPAARYHGGDGLLDLGLRTLPHRQHPRETNHGHV